MPGNLQPGTSTLMIQAAGLSRTVYLHVPQAVTGGQVPLVLALHGDGDTAQNFVTATGLVADADAEGFVLAAPQGMTRDVDVHEAGMVVQTIPQIDWDPYNAIQADGSFTSQYNDDMPLLDMLRQQLVASGSIDVHKIIVYGYSQGGYMSFRYGMSDAADIGCAAVIAAAHPAPGTRLVETAARKVPVVLQIGTADPAYGNAQQTAQELMTNGNLVQLNTIQAAGHVPVPGDPKVPLDWCLQHALP
jgi:polyhydroxybutyrate depolymerase